MCNHVKVFFYGYDNIQTYTTRIFLNIEEAKKRLDELQSKVETLRKKKDEAARAGDWPTFNSLKKQLDQANNEIRSMQTSAQKIDRVLGNLSTASVKEIQQSIKAINAELSNGAIERGRRTIRLPWRHTSLCLFHAHGLIIPCARFN